MISICVTSDAPCAGASSVCAALCALAAKIAAYPRVLCADASEGRLGASQLFGALPGGDLPDADPRGDEDADVMDNLCISSCGVCVLRCAGAGAARFSGILKALPFDLAFIDCGLRGSEAHGQMLEDAGLELCVVAAEGNCLARLDGIKPSVRERFVINRFDCRSKSMYDCRLFLSSSVLAPRLLRTTIPFDEAVLSSTLSLKPYPLSSPFSAASDAASGVLAEILSLCGEAGGKP